MLDPTIGEPVPDKLELYGVDSDGPLPPEHQSCIEVEPPTSNITQESFHELQRLVNPFRESDIFGIDLYLEALGTALSSTNDE